MELEARLGFFPKGKCTVGQPVWPQEATAALPTHPKAGFTQVHFLEAAVCKASSAGDVCTAGEDSAALTFQLT